jgi:uncharacterized protein
LLEIFVDADACPVKDEIERVAERHGLAVTIVSNSGMRPSRNPRFRHVLVTEGPDAADDWIAEHIGAGDIAVTADIPLASRCLAKGAHVVAPNGKVWTAANIGNALAGRELSRHLRELGVATSGPAAMNRQDRSRFLSALDTAVQQALRAATAQ